MLAYPIPCSVRIMCQPLRSLSHSVSPGSRSTYPTTLTCCQSATVGPPPVTWGDASRATPPVYLALSRTMAVQSVRSYQTSSFGGGGALEGITCVGGGSGVGESTGGGVSVTAGQSVKYALTVSLCCARSVISGQIGVCVLSTGMLCTDRVMTRSMYSSVREMSGRVVRLSPWSVTPLPGKRSISASEVMSAACCLSSRVS